MGRFLLNDGGFERSPGKNAAPCREGKTDRRDYRCRVPILSWLRITWLYSAWPLGRWGAGAGDADWAGACGEGASGAFAIGAGATGAGAGVGGATPWRGARSRACCRWI